MQSYGMKTIFRIFSAFLAAVLLVSCGTAGKGAQSDKQETELADSTEKRDTFVPLHPPIVVPHTWKDVR